MDETNLKRLEAEYIAAVREAAPIMRQAEEASAKVDAAYRAAYGAGSRLPVPALPELRFSGERNRYGSVLRLWREDAERFGFLEGTQ